MTEGAARVVAGRYRLVRAIGRGGMATVWHAHDVLLGRDVAVKEIWFPGAGHDSDGPLAQRALREAQAAARLRHPGVVTVHDVVIEQGRPWLVMELVSGRSLAQAIEDHGLLTERRTAEIGLLVLDALRAAHRAGITHRDVKPANILLDDADRVVLTDFGIAVIDDATALTATGQMVGSPAYLAPERINGRPASAASDLWSLGVTLYTVVTGRSPFQRGDTQATLAAVLTARPAAPAHAGRLWPVIKGLLAKDPARRLTAEQARTLLTNVVERDAAAAPATAWRRPRWWPGSPKRLSDGPDGTPGTVEAPSPTLATPTDHRPRPELAALPTGSAASVSEPAAPVGAGPDDPTARAPDPAVTAAEAVVPRAVTVDPAVTSSAVVDTTVSDALAIAPAPSVADGQVPAVDGRAPHPDAGEQPGPAEVTTVRSADRSRRTVRRNRILVGVLAVALIITGAATWQWYSRTAADQREVAAAERIAAAARQKETAAAQPTVLSKNLGAEATSISSTDPERAALLALYAYHYSPTSEAVAGLRSVTARTLEFTGRSPELAIDGVGAVTYSPDGNHLATAGYDRTVRVWDLNKGTVRTLKGHTGAVNAVAYGPDGRRLASAGADSTVRIWNLNTGAVRTLTGHTGYVFEVAYSRDGQVASGAHDNTVRLWSDDMTPAAMVARICRARHRDLTAAERAMYHLPPANGTPACP